MKNFKIKTNGKKERRIGNNEFEKNVHNQIINEINDEIKRR